MPDLTEAMRQATEAIPPSGIDLDSIIGDHYRRTRRLRGLAVAGGAIAVATALAAGRLLTAGPNPPVGAGPAPSAPTSSRAPAHAARAA